MAPDLLVFQKSLSNRMERSVYSAVVKIRLRDPPSEVAAVDQPGFRSVGIYRVSSASGP
jgi:hypothetical protein